MYMFHLARDETRKTKTQFSRAFLPWNSCSIFSFHLRNFRLNGSQVGSSMRVSMGLTVK